MTEKIVVKPVTSALSKKEVFCEFALMKQEGNNKPFHLTKKEAFALAEHLTEQANQWLAEKGIIHLTDDEWDIRTP